MVNKGRIHMELMYFRDIFWKLIKLDDELSEKLGKMVVLERYSKIYPRNQKSLNLD